MLTYKTKRSFIITVNLGHNSYEFQRCNNKDSVKRKYKGMELYSLPLALFSSKPLGIFDQRYFDSRHDPIVNPLETPLRIELYNDKLLRSTTSSIRTHSSIIDQPTSEYDAVVFKLHTLISLDTPTNQYNTDDSAISGILFQKPYLKLYETTYIPTLKAHESIEIKEDLLMRQTSRQMSVDCGGAIRDLSRSSISFVAAVHRDRDNLCFVSYIPSGTMLRRWYLIQLCLDATATLVPNYTFTGKYYTVF